MNEPNTTSWASRLGLAVLIICTPASALPGEPDFNTLEKRFRQLPTEARRLTGPLFWLHGDETKERLQTYVGKVAEGGNGCFTAESRPHNDWLGEGWYRDLAICLDAAKAHDLKLWIFDEKWWPSGEVGGKVPAAYGSKRLVADSRDVAGPASITEEGYGGSNFIGAVAGRVNPDGIEGTSLVDLAPCVRGSRLEWQAPAGQWKVMKFSWKPRISGGRYLVDGASQDCVDWYVRTVYQPHYDRFKDEFGRTIQGFFYDEPETHGDWGTEVMRIFAERKIDWMKPLVAYKFKLAGEEQAAARYQYRDALAEAWGRTLFGGVSRWCREHGVASIGHFLEHGNGYLHPELCAGNMFQLQKYSDMGALDAVFDQFVWGKRTTRDHPVWQTPKLCSSVTHAYGKPDDVTMVEIFGARGQDLTYPEMKWWTDHMHASGVNFHIPHSFNPRSPRDTDCPPYFYNGGFEPRWPLYRVYADYTSRLSVMLSGGAHVCPVALLYLGNSAHVGKAFTPEILSEALQDALFDCDWIPYDVFENGMRVSGQQLELRSEGYRILVVPPVEVIPYPTLAKVKEFFDAGGVVVGYGFLPSRSATLGYGSSHIDQLRQSIWGEARPGLTACKVNGSGGRSYLLPEKPTPEQLQQVFAGDAGLHPTLEVLEGNTSHWLHVLHRVKSGRDVFFVANQNHLGQARSFRLRLTADGYPECWDAMRNEIRTLAFNRSGRQVELALTLEPNESVLVVFNPDKRPLPTRIGSAATRPAQVIPVIRDATPAVATPLLETVVGPARLLEGGSWIWYPEGDPRQSAPPGKRYFRSQVTIPADRNIAKATFAGTADNYFTLFINGRETGHSDDSAEGWRNPVELDVKAKLRPGANQLAIVAVNSTDRPSPTGLIGCLEIQFEQGPPMIARVDHSWKASDRLQVNWSTPDFDDSGWKSAKEIAPFGGAPWGRLGGGQLTLSPAKPDPYHGHCEIADLATLSRQAVYLEVAELAPEAAARVTVNGVYAGGFIGKPFRLEVTSLLKQGPNSLVIEPFAPKSARLVILE